MATANPYVGATRAVLGQGLGMGWGDEGEAWIREKLGQGKYEDLVKQIRQEYGQYAKENPYTAGALEFGGGAAPGIAAMLIPGGQAAGTAALQRSTMGALARLAGAGAASGAIGGAGAANEGDRLTGAGTGAVIGGTVGVALPTLLRGTGTGYKWLRDRLFPTDSTAQNRATALLADAVAERGKRAGVDITKTMEADRILGVPSVVANVSPATARLARGVEKRSANAADIIEPQLYNQRVGTRERVYNQADRALKPGDYFADEQKLVETLRQRAGTAYDEAYAHGTVDDPRINQVLKDPSFAGFFEKAQAIAKKEQLAAKLRGEDPTKFELQDIYKLAKDADGNVIVVSTKLPDVRTLDYIKRGIDATIDTGYAGSGMGKAEATALRDLRKGFVNALDENVPLYKQARQSYAGDIEVIDAMRAGLKDFPNMKHEEVVKLVSAMSPTEKEAFRTGVARNIYGQIMTPSGNINAAQKLMSPEMQSKLQPLFDSPEHFRLFKNALERESQLFQQSSRILGGADTAENLALGRMIEGGGGGAETGSLAASAITGGFWPSLIHTTLSNLKPGQMTEKTAGKLADMLMAKDPHEVAAVVKLLSEHTAGAIPKAAAKAAAEMGVVTGTTAAIFPSPSGVPEAPVDIESAAGSPTATIEGPDIEADLAKMK